MDSKMKELLFLKKQIGKLSELRTMRVDKQEIYLKKARAELEEAQQESKKAEEQLRQHQTLSQQKKQKWLSAYMQQCLSINHLKQWNFSEEKLKAEELEFQNISAQRQEEVKQKEENIQVEKKKYQVAVNKNERLNILKSWTSS